MTQTTVKKTVSELRRGDVVLAAPCGEARLVLGCWPSWNEGQHVVEWVSRWDSLESDMQVEVVDAAQSNHDS